eukprot:4854162-Karenia_brevis.AAC.1
MQALPGQSQQQLMEVVQHLQGLAFQMQSMLPVPGPPPAETGPGQQIIPPNHPQIVAAGGSISQRPPNWWWGFPQGPTGPSIIS